jgi:ATP-binding cassette subfamily E protein 1
LLLKFSYLYLLFSHYSPVNKTGKLCIEVTPESKISHISEELCIGCGICVKKCPFDAITIINLPSNLDKDTTHRYGPNAFKLHRLPTPRPGQVLGLVGSNGTGKTTALRVLAGKLKPNLGKYSVKLFFLLLDLLVLLFRHHRIGKIY